MDPVSVSVRGGNIHISRGNQAMITMTFSEARTTLDKLLEAILDFGKIDANVSRKRRISELEAELTSLRNITS